MLAQIPVLQAQESLRLATATALGSGSMKKAAAQSQISEWNREARDGTTPRSHRAQSRDEFAALVTAAGSSVAFVPNGEGA